MDIYSLNIFIVSFALLLLPDSILYISPTTANNNNNK